MDGLNMLPLEEKYHVGISGEPLDDDIVEIDGRYYRCTQGILLDVTHAFNLRIGGNSDGQV